MTRTVDITPTWKGVLRLMVEVAGNGTSEKGRQSAWAELTRMADLADRYVAEHSPAPEPAPDPLMDSDTARVEATIAWVGRFNSELDRLEISPNGDDYNDLVGGVLSILQDGVVPTTITQLGGRAR
jgi:hypothetical protein